MISIEVVESDLKEFSLKKLEDFIGDYPTPSEIINANVRFAWIQIDGVKRYGILYEILKPKLLITGAMSNDSNGLFLAKVVPYLEDFARRLDCDRVEFHTERLGMIRAGQMNGYKIESVRLIKRL